MADLVDDLVGLEIREQNTHLLDADLRAWVRHERGVRAKNVEQRRAALVLDVFANLVCDGGVEALFFGHFLLDIYPRHLRHVSA